jgi:hypothetical protein
MRYPAIQSEALGEVFAGTTNDAAIRALADLAGGPFMQGPA